MAFPPSGHDHFFKYRLALLLGMGTIVPLGYVVRFYQGGQGWLNDAFGSIAYEIFWILLVVFLFPKVSLLGTAIGVCFVTCGLEFLQLWQPPFLQATRATFVGRLILGNTFSWSDFPSYFVGSFLGWILIRLFHQKYSSHKM